MHASHWGVAPLRFWLGGSGVRAQRLSAVSWKSLTHTSPAEFSKQATAIIKSGVHAFKKKKNHTGQNQYFKVFEYLYIEIQIYKKKILSL